MFLLRKDNEGGGTATGDERETVQAIAPRHVSASSHFEVHYYWRMVFE